MMTNFDKIKAMSKQEMAEYIAGEYISNVSHYEECFTLETERKFMMPYAEMSGEIISDIVYWLGVEATE